MISFLPFLVVGIIILLGMYTVVARHDLIKIAMGLSLVEAGVNLFLITIGYREGGIAPIYTNAPDGALMVMPTVQALTLTSIVIGVATIALILSFIMIIYRHYQTADVREVTRLRG